jgi:hypothetical protein
MAAFGRITPPVMLVALLVTACGEHSTEARSTSDDRYDSCREERANRPALLGVRSRARAR